MIYFQLLILLVVFIGGFLAGKNYGETVTTAKMGDDVIRAHLTQRELDAAIAFPELNAALENFVASLAALGKCAERFK